MNMQFRQPNIFDPLAKMAEAEHVEGPQYINVAREVLRALVAEPRWLDAMALEHQAGAYTRNLLFKHGRFGIWVINWAPGSETSIHDHHCSCCFGMVKGTLVERWFRPEGGDTVSVTHEALRDPGYTACMLPSGPNIHQMCNTTTENAVSVHIYGFDPDQKTSSIDRVYRNSCN